MTEGVDAASVSVSLAQSVRMCVCVCVCACVTAAGCPHLYLSICTLCMHLYACARVRLQAQIGAVAGIVAATSCFPFEVVRRRQMGGELTSLSVIGAMCAQRAHSWPGAEQPMPMRPPTRSPPACSGRLSEPERSAPAA